MREYITFSDMETQQLGERLGAKINTSKVIALYGGLGMGKTAFCRGFAKGMDSDDDVSSPTFALVNEYRGRLPIYHFDMYRVSGWDDLYSTGFFDYLDTDSVLIIEWSENIENALPGDVLRITISKGENENERRFVFGEEWDLD